MSMGCESEVRDEGGLGLVVVDWSYPVGGRE